MENRISPPGPCILVVDDEAAQMRALCDTLRDQGYEVTGVAAPAAALDALQTSRFEIMLTDLSMPGTDGITLLRAARERDPDLVVIIMTGEGSIASAVEAMKAGAFDYILKPFRLSAILPVLERAMMVRRLRLENAELALRLQQHAAELEAANRELGRKTEELESARQAAEEGARAKAAFLATMSHEIRTPLNAILGMIELLGATGLKEQQREYVQIAHTSSEHLLGLINDVLDFSRADAGKLELEQRPFNLLTCVEESLSLIATRAYAKNLELAYRYESQLPVNFIGDAGRLRQVLVNLLTNAVKFTASGEVVVSVAGEEKGGEFEVGIAVRDSGIGIPADKQDRLFQAFSQVDASTTREYGGTGLGLAICKRIVEAMGGRIGVVSDAGEGATFKFSIPLEADAPREPAAAVQPELQGVGVLLADGNAAHRQALRQQFSSWGMTVRGAASASEARACLDAAPDFVIAVVNHAPPALDGIALVRQLREGSAGDRLRFIILTAPGPRESAVRDAGLAPSGVVVKPVRQSTLRNALLAVRSTDGRRRPPAAEVGRQGPGQKLRILLVEDNVVNQRVAQLMLEKLNQEVDLATNGREALLALGRSSYDLVLMDMLMPEMDGLEATRRIRDQLPPERQPRIVAMTANASAGDRNRCLAAGMDDYVSKPVSLEKLAQVLERGTHRQVST